MARKMTMTKEQQIRGCRKALANPKTPKQFLPGLKKRLKELLAAIAFVLVLPALSHAQFQGYTTPQSVQQTLAGPGTACTGSPQNFTVINLGQTQHYALLIPSPSVIGMEMVIQGTDVLGNVATISDAVFPSSNTLATTDVTASGYYPKISIVVTCLSNAGTFNLTYSGTSSTPNVVSGSYLLSLVDKNIFAQAATQGTNHTSTFFTTPYGHSGGRLLFGYLTASIAGSSVQVLCNTATAQQTIVNLPIANSLALQTFQVPDQICGQVAVQYASGGASANGLSLDYLFDPPGTSSMVTSAGNLSQSLNENAQFAEKGPRWDVFLTPAAGSQATASKAAGTNGVRHVADCVTWSAGAAAAPAATLLTINLRDGATGAGTILWQTTINAAATAAQHGSGQVCGLNLIGSTNTAMTLEFSASLANESESVTLTGYDVQ